MTSRLTVVFQFMTGMRSRPALPPNQPAETSRDQRNQEEKNPPQIAQRIVGHAERERLCYFRGDADECFAAQKPVDAAGNEIESLLILGKGIVLNKGRVANHYDAR